MMLIITVWIGVVFVVKTGNGTHIEDTFSTKLVIGSLERFSKVGDADVGGFMLAFEKIPHIAAVHAIAPELTSRDAVGYISEFSLQYSFEKLLVRSPGSIPAAVRVTITLNVVVFSILLTILTIGIHREFGVIEAVAVAFCYLLSLRTLAFVGHIYWMLPLLIAPVCIFWNFYPTLRRQPAALTGLIAFGLLFVKSLCGYAFISCVIISSIIPTLYYECKQCFDNPQYPRSTAIFWIFLPMVAGALGVVAAICAHIAKAAEYLGDLRRGVAAILVPLTYSSFSGDDLRRAVHVRDVFGAAKVYVEVGIFPFGLNLAAAFLLVAAVLASGLRLRFVTLPYNEAIRLDSGQRALAISSLAATAASLSWWLMLKHNIIHTHINWIIYTLFLVPFLVLLATNVFICEWRVAKEILKSRKEGQSTIRQREK
jgi:hypothetical protein